MGTYDCQVYGTPTFGAAKFSNGLTAVSANNKLHIPKELFAALSTSWTIEMWLKDGTTAVGIALASENTNLCWIGTQSDAKFAASVYVNGSYFNLTSNVLSNDGNWHHVALVCDSGSSVSFYVDGTLKSTKTGTITNPGSSTFGYIGCWGVSSLYAWTGDIDEIAFWNSAKYTGNFTPASSAYSGTEANLLALYHLEADGTDSETDVTISVATPAFTEYGPSTLGLEWAAASGGAAPYTYQVQISTNGTDYTDEGDPQSGLTYSDTGLSASTTYYYRIVATDANAASGTGTAASKATLATGLKYNRRDLTGAASGADVMVLIPNANSAHPYSAGTSTPLLMYFHGMSGDVDNLISDSLMTDTTTALLDAGYICCGVSAGDNWGNQAGCNYYADLYYTVNLYYNLSYTLLLSQSMGGLAGLSGLSQNKIPGVIAWAGIYPVCSLSAAYIHSSFTASINTAYSCTSTTYAAKTFGHDPCLKWGKAFRNVPMRFYASPSDTYVVKTTNSDAFKALVATSCSESVVIECTGNHGDPSHFQPTDLVAFYERALASPVPTSGLGSGGKVSITSFSAEVSL